MFVEEGVDINLTDFSLDSDYATGPHWAGNCLSRAARSPSAGGPVCGAPVRLRLSGVKPGGAAPGAGSVAGGGAGVPSAAAAAGVPATVSFCPQSRYLLS